MAIDYISKLSLKLNGSEVYGMSPLGLTTSSFQPAFSAYRPFATTSTFITGTGDITNGWVASFNRGNHFNASTGRFTAPVAGCYYYTMMISSIQLQLGILVIAVNGSQYSRATRVLSDVGWSNTTLPFVVYLNANDYVTCNVVSYTGNAGSARMSISGYFIG